MIKFSIITVCFNAGATIRKTLDSVSTASQYFKDTSVEHIIIDGCSTDETLNIVASYPHLKVFSEPDDGIFDAMNKGIAKSKGEIIGIINADDWYEPNTLKLVDELFKESSNVDIVHGSMKIWKGKDCIARRNPSVSRFFGAYVFPFFHPTFFVKKEIYQRFGCFNTSYKISADYDFYLRTRSKCHYKNAEEVIANFRIGGISTTSFSLKERMRVRRNNGLNAILSFIIVLIFQIRKLFVNR